MAIGRYLGGSISRDIARDISMRREDEVAGGGPPPVSEPVNFTATADGAFDGGVTIPYVSATGNVLVRICGRTNGPGTLDFTATWNGAPMTVFAGSVQSGANHVFTWTFYIRGGSVGAGDIVIAPSGPSTGRGAVRIQDLAANLSEFQPDGQNGGVNSTNQVVYFPENFFTTTELYSTILWMNAAADPIAQTAPVGAEIEWQSNIPAGPGSNGVAFAFTKYSGVSGEHLVQFDSAGGTSAETSYWTNGFAFD